VTVDLDTIPLEDVLAFKRASAGEHRRYTQNLRAFTLDLSAMAEADRARALADREPTGARPSSSDASVRFEPARGPGCGRAAQEISFVKN
jgi:hypothetical protein